MESCPTFKAGVSWPAVHALRETRAHRPPVHLRDGLSAFRRTADCEEWSVVKLETGGKR